MKEDEAGSGKVIEDQQIPVYNIKAVARMVGLLPVTLRAWERRYGLPQPRRGGQGYRLYSEHDLHTLRWLKAQIEAGLNISRAVEYLNELRASGQDPANNFLPLPKEQIISLNTLSLRLLAALSHFDEKAASEAIQHALARYSFEQVIQGLLQPVMVELGEAWHRGEMPIAVEHFATQFYIQHLMTLLAASPSPTRCGLVVAACAPGETHQLGLLSLVVMLRRRGWDVRYLGPDLKLDRLEESLVPLAPRLLMFTATLVETARRLESLPLILNRFPEPRPLLVLGGQAFRDYRLPETVPAVYLDSTAGDIVTSIERILNHLPAD